MDGFDHILNWKLKEGSHPFPGKDGGTCINEAALVAAGFEYRPIRRVEDMPKCFSRPICRLAMQLNDMANDAERQQLLPFVTKLACADTSQVERKRAAYIALRTQGPSTFQEAIETLRGALAIGRQAEALAPDAAKTSGNWWANTWSPLTPMEVAAEILPATLAGGWRGELWNRRRTARISWRCSPPPPSPTTRAGWTPPWAWFATLPKSAGSRPN